MKGILRVIVVAALASALGCTRADWIDRTLVTVDVTGTWEGSALGRSSFQFELEQQGGEVKGNVRGFMAGGTGAVLQIKGTVAGDVLTFRGSTDSRFAGELTVSGDEMSGSAYLPYAYPRSTLFLQRVISPSRPSSPQH